jgi:methylated-DNA-[protein]-cysteine S-methyltransferase
MSISPELDARFRAAASDAGLLDVAYDVVDSPVGALFIATTDAGLCRISYDAEPERQLERLAKEVGTKVLRSAKPIDAVRRQLDEYFEQKRTRFDLPIDLHVRAEFTLRVLEELARVPYGETATYGELARRVERPRAARAVGTVMHNNPIPIVLPCHRIVGSSGSLVGYGGGIERKELLLKLEGATL